VLRAGTTLSPSRIAALAAAGVARPTCGARPRVAVVTTGTELRSPGEPLGDGEIYESNGVMLAAVFRSAGAQVAPHATVSDDPAGRYPHCLAAVESPWRRRPRRDARDDRERPGSVGCPEGEAVHRRAREARQVDGRDCVGCEDAPGRVCDRHGLARERRGAREDAGERVLDRDWIGHGADGTHGVRSGA
jgi:hypothetical protein